jgi:hypothetical protein
MAARADEKGLACAPQRVENEGGACAQPFSGLAVHAAEGFVGRAVARDHQ